MFRAGNLLLEIANTPIEDKYCIIFLSCVSRFIPPDLLVKAKTSFQPITNTVQNVARNLLSILTK